MSENNTINRTNKVERKNTVNRTNTVNTTNESSLSIFNNDQFGEIRVINRNGNPWFVAADLCRALDIGDTHKALTRLDEDEKGKSLIPTPGGVQEMSIVSEAGMYTLVLSSRKPEAHAFNRWITHDVIPDIRKHGMYATPMMIDKILADPDSAIKVLTALKQEREKNAALTTTNAVQAQQLAEAQPKLTYYDMVLKSTGLTKTSVIASDYGMSARKLNQILSDLKVQYKQGNIWLLYDLYKHRGYTQTETYTYENRKTGETGTNCWMKWTQKGRLFLYDLLKANGYLPVCEQEA